MNYIKYLSNQELKHLEYILKSRVDTDTRNCLLLLLAIKTGARASELLGIKVSDLSSCNSSVLIRGVKGSRDREIPLEKRFYQTLIRYSKTISSELLFDISYDRLWQVWDQYRPVRKKFHALRHSFGVNLYKKTRDIHLVKHALGHKSISNTMVYLDFVYSQQQLRKAIA